MPSSLSFEEKLVERAEAIAAKPPSDAAVAAAEIRISDTIACALGGLQSEVATTARNVSGLFPGKPAASLWFTPQRSDLFSAGLVNGIASRYLDFNDTYLGICEGRHPSDAIPLLWAMAEAEGLAPSDLIRAIVLAYALDIALSDNIAVSAHGLDNVFYGGLAAALGASHLLKLDRAQTVNALRIACTTTLSPGKIRFGELSMWKSVAGPWAARSGIESAYLARAGMSGPPSVFEGKWGIFQLLSLTDVKADAVLTAADAPLAVEQSSIKIYPTQYHTQAAVECALRLHKRIDEPIENIKIDTYQFAYLTAVADPEKWKPSTRETADHSLPCCVAMALAEGEVNESSFSKGIWRSDSVRQLMERMTVTVDPAMTAAFPETAPTRVTIVTKSGEAITDSVDFPLGHRRRPASPQVLSEKFLSLAGPVIGEAAGIRLQQRLQTLKDAKSLPDLSATDFIANAH
jgi:2-methylcitrate dehydratase